MAKFEVVRPWHGVKLGQVVDMAKLHPALKPNVRPLRGEAAGLEVATPSAGTGSDKPPTKGEIAARLKEMGVPFDGRQSVAELAALLPEGDPLKSTTE